MNRRERFAHLLNEYFQNDARSSDAWLARRVVVSRTTVGRWRREETLPQHPGMMIRIAASFNCNETECNELLETAGYSSGSRQESLKFQEFIVNLSAYLDKEDKEKHDQIRENTHKAIKEIQEQTRLSQSPKTPPDIERDAEATLERMQSSATSGGIASQLAHLINRVEGLHERAERPELSKEEVLSAALERLETMPLEEVPAPAPLPVRSRMKTGYNSMFVGREAEMRFLAETLKGGQTVAVGQTAAATGLGGIGKTQLAAAFAHRYGQFFTGGVFWISCGETNIIPSEVASCAHWMFEELGDWDRPELVRRVMQAWREPIPRLLIFDNCEDQELLRNWRPPFGGCRVLITSRRQHWHRELGIQLLPLDILPRPQSIQLLRKLMGENKSAKVDDVALDAIAKELGDLPLAVHMAGSFLGNYSITPETYLQDLHRINPLTHPSLTKGDMLPLHYNHHVARTFALSYDKLQNDDRIDSLARRLLACAAHFAPGEPVWQLQLLSTVPEENAGLATADALRRLANLGLISMEAAETVRLHRLLARYVLNNATDRREEAKLAVAETMLFEADRLNDQGIPEPLLPWQVHLRYITNTMIPERKEVSAGLCEALGLHLRIAGEFEEALPYYQKASAIHLHVLGKRHVKTANSLNSLGAILFFVGRPEEARSYIEQALEIRRAVLGNNHLKVADSLNNLGVLLQSQGEPKQAYTYLEQALVITQKVLGEKHPSTAQGLSNIGALLYMIGKPKEGIPYLKRALGIVYEVLGEKHPDTASILNNLGEMLESTGELDEAYAYLKQALIVAREIVNDDHFIIINIFENLGKVLHSMGKLEEAHRYLEKALIIAQEVFDSKHPDIATISNSLGRLLLDMGKLEEAKFHYKQSLILRSEVLGDQSPDTLSVQENLKSLGNHYE